MMDVSDSDLKKIKKTLLNPSFDLINVKYTEKNWNQVNKYNIEVIFELIKNSQNQKTYTYRIRFNTKIVSR